MYYCLQEMDKVGVDMFVDVHGDEEIPMNFVSGMEGLKGWGPRLQALQGAFVNSYVRFNPDFQSEISYEPEPPNEGNLAICSNHVANRFNCLGMTRASSSHFIATPLRKPTQFQTNSDKLPKL